MLKNIKSSYFIKSVFSYLTEIRKLETIKYNKKFQNIVDLSLNNYKLFSGTYIKYEVWRKWERQNI